MDGHDQFVLLGFIPAELYETPGPTPNSQRFHPFIEGDNNLQKTKCKACEEVTQHSSVIFTALSETGMSGAIRYIKTCVDCGEIKIIADKKKKADD
jgi:hypothetical protein